MLRSAWDWLAITGIIAGFCVVIQTLDDDGCRRDSRPVRAWRWLAFLLSPLLLFYSIFDRDWQPELPAVLVLAGGDLKLVINAIALGCRPNQLDRLNAIIGRLRKNAENMDSAE